MKISLQPGSAISSIGAKSKGNPNTPSTANSQSGPSATPQTQLSTELGMVQAARQQLETLPDVDMDKVTRLRQAIAAGELPLDMDALSQAIIDLHRS